MELNIEKAVNELIKKALAKYEKKKDACTALGISKPTLAKKIKLITITKNR